MRPRWIIAGGKSHPSGRIIALKGDPVWGELGSYDNFDDALGVDHPPFAFNSGMRWKEISAAECRSLKITGPNGESIEDWQASRPAVMAGKLPLPAPKISLRGVDPALVKRFMASTRATPDKKRPGVLDYNDILAREVAAHDRAYYNSEEAAR
jgi:hypothetical protein